MLETEHTLDELNEPNYYGEDGDFVAVRGDISREDAFERMATLDEELNGKDSTLRRDHSAADLVVGVSWWSVEDHNWCATVNKKLMPQGVTHYPVWVLRS